MWIPLKERIRVESRGYRVKAERIPGESREDTG
jgi:hypothetical protein